MMMKEEVHVYGVETWHSRGGGRCRDKMLEQFRVA
jgi:hypothetical protein